MGSPNYCTPEQILGWPVDGRRNIYSFGCTLYELVVGRLPFDADDIDGAFQGHLHGTPSFDAPPLVSMGEPFLRWLRRFPSRTRANRPDAATACAALCQLLPPQVIERLRWAARASAAFPVLRETVEWKVRA